MEKNEIDSKQNLKKEENEEILSIPPESKTTEENQINEKIICDFIMKEKLGEGTFGKVRLGINNQTEEEVAIKILDKKKIIREKDKIRLDKEIKILKSLRHPNIVHLYADIQTKTNIYLIMEYIKGIELLHYISSNSNLNEEEACFYFRQIISAIEYLHKLKIAHRDIKPENMIIENSTKTIKLVDFGLSSYYNTKSELLQSACGSPSYAPPEMLYGKKYSASPVDIWSCGIVLYAMICGYLPFDDLDHDILFKKIKEGIFKIPEKVSENAKDLIKNILVTNPKKRYTIEQIKKHKWFKLCLNNENYRNKKSLYEGLLLNKYVVPLDEGIIKQMNNQYKIEKEKIRICLLKNEHNDITTIYDLILLKKSKSENESVADLKGNLFKKYLEDNTNLLSNYDNDINKVIEERKNNKEDNDINDKEDEQKENIINDQDNKDNNNNENDLNNEQNEQTYNINNNLNLEKDNNQNNINIGDNDEKINIDNKDNYKILKSKEKSNEKIQKVNKIKVIKIDTPEKVKKSIKLTKNTESHKNKNFSTSKRTINTKLSKNLFNEIKENIQRNKSQSKDIIKKVSKKKNIKIINTNKIKEKNNIKVKGISNNNKKEVIEKHQVHNNTSANNNARINSINNEIKENNENKNIQKEKKFKTYKPNPVKYDEMKNKINTYTNKEDRKNKTIIVKNKNMNKVRHNQSADKRRNFKTLQNSVVKRHENINKDTSPNSIHKIKNGNNNKKIKSLLLSGTCLSSRKNNKNKNMGNVIKH